MASNNRFDPFIEKSELGSDLKKILFQHSDRIQSALIPSKIVSEICDTLKLSKDDLIRNLLPLAASLAYVPVSDYKVGAILIARSGDLVLGANIEFGDDALQETIHAEQAALTNAYCLGIDKIVKLAVSAAPCGFCRQIINELPEAENISVLIGNQPAQKFGSLLPDSFGPGHLGLSGLKCSDIEMRPDEGLEDKLLIAAIDAASRSYAPYTRNLNGTAFRMSDDTIITGSSIENAAFNPGIYSLQAAIIRSLLAGYRFKDIKDACLVSQRFGLCEMKYRELFKSLCGVSVPFTQIDHS